MDCESHGGSAVAEELRKFEANVFLEVYIEISTTQYNKGSA